MSFTKLFRCLFHIPLLLIFSFSNPALSAVEDTLNTSVNKLIKDTNEIKSPDQAFQLKAAFNDLDEIELTWLIDKKCFLYKEKLEISISPKQKFTSKTTNTAVRQDDEFFGNVEVYYNSLRYFLIADFNCARVPCRAISKIEISCDCIVVSEVIKKQKMNIVIF